MINEGCFIPNCMQRNWESKKQGNFEQKTNGNLLTGFQYELPQRTNVLMRKEAKLYTVIHYLHC